MTGRKGGKPDPPPTITISRWRHSSSGQHEPNGPRTPNVSPTASAGQTPRHVAGLADGESPSLVVAWIAADADGRFAHAGQIEHVELSGLERSAAAPSSRKRQIIRRHAETFADQLANLYRVRQPGIRRRAARCPRRSWLLLPNGGDFFGQVDADRTPGDAPPAADAARSRRTGRSTRPACASATGDSGSGCEFRTMPPFM